MLRVTKADVSGREEWQIAREFTDNRLEVIRLLHEACQVEHALLVQYLYAAYSVRDRYHDIVGTASPDIDRKNEPTLMEIALDEMLHLRDVNRILLQLGAAPSLAHQDFPYEPEIYPFPMRLERLSHYSVARYLYAEAPPGAITDTTDFGRTVLRVLRDAAPPEDQNLRQNYVGSLYRTVTRHLQTLGDDASRYPVDQWIQTLTRIQGEGEGRHFEFFRRVFLADIGSLRDAEDPWRDPDSESFPSYALPTNPTALAGRPNTMTGPIGAVAQIGNLTYWTMLLLLDHTYRTASADVGKDNIGSAVLLMTEVLHHLSRVLAGENAGLPFDPLNLGHAPCVVASGNLQMAADFLNQATAVFEDLPAQVRERVAPAMTTVAEAHDHIRRAGRRAGATVVVGAGPAGLAAAIALADKGVPVHLIESSRIIGGKVNSEEVDIAGRRRSFEHGVHGWWKSYVNFFALLEKAGVDLESAFKHESYTSMVVGPGDVKRMELLPIPLPSPLFLVAQILKAPYLRGWRDLWSLRKFTAHVLAFRHETDAEVYDKLSLETFLTDMGVSEQARRHLFRSFALNLGYLTPDEISAYVILSAFQFYILPSRDAILPRWTRGLPQRSVFGPLAKAVERRGGTVERSARATRLLIRESMLEGVEVEGSGVGAHDSIRVADVPEHGVSLIETDAGSRVFAARRGQEYIVFEAVCPHMNGPLVVEFGEFRCLTHGGRFRADGTLIDGPPKSNLSPLPVTQIGDRLEFQRNRSRHTIFCTDVIIATDVRAARALLSGMIAEELERDLANLETTPVLAVRMWFPLGTALTMTDLPTAVTPIGELVDNYFHLNRIDSSYDAEGEVIEIQGCREPQRWTKASDMEVIEWVLRDLKKMQVFREDVPQPEYFEVNRHLDVFTKYAPGSAALRPGAHSGIEGVWLAGDWTRPDWSAWFMEYAVISGLRAANEVLRARGLSDYPIRRLAGENPLLRVSRVAARLMRKWMK